ncbi:hypothetical protein FJM67_06365 [Maribrevibacterium harenarium]|uniref:Uncharacterized protein n=1 Tax=Maribrevibacterium harenarium TaxID=2589817 RepID=A0A501WZT4_9GAMM|nr:hypothetical protein FJM67_06365 [Maribrevibacterium harenarium]
MHGLASCCGIFELFANEQYKAIFFELFETSKSALKPRAGKSSYSIFWICSLSSGLEPNKLNELSKRNRSKMPVCPPNCPPLAYGFY